MKYLDEFRDPAKAKILLADIDRLLPKIDSARFPLQLMEFCGGHTHTIFRYGVERLLPKEIELVHGPGCPVCVLPMGRVDDCVALAERPEVIFTTFGDAIRVPGSRKSLMQAKADGADLRIVYSPLDALAVAQRNPDREVIFFALGFETTMPSTALTVLAAKAAGVKNFSLFCNHITSVPTVRALLESPGLRLDGFVAPGHVSMVVGADPFQFVASEFGKPLVISGFEPLDILQSIWMLVRQLAEGRAAVETQYTRVVRDAGNAPGLAAMHQVYELRDFFEWRGLGSIPQSGVKIREPFAAFDAERRFAVPNQKIADPQACQCGDVLKGRMRPWQCKVFGTSCTPETPLGALMVSSEGACAAYYRFGDLDDLLHRREAAPTALPVEAD
ncbi:MAG: hydrogenase formation protein HypD [Magnetospiraceae bacterium]